MLFHKPQKYRWLDEKVVGRTDAGDRAVIAPLINGGNVHVGSRTVIIRLRISRRITCRCECRRTRARDSSVAVDRLNPSTFLADNIMT